MFLQSPDGMLYSDGTGYTSSDCDLSGSSSDEWDSYETYEEPFDLGESEGWAALCDAFFNYQVAGDLYWGDEEVILSSFDCEAAAP